MMNLQRFILLSLLFTNVLMSFSQTDSTWSKKPTFTVSGFLDVFYVFDFNQPTGSKRLDFFYNHNRHNEFNVNLCLLKLGIQHSKYRANLALHFGTYPNDNYVSEPGLLKLINEANIGISLNKNNNLWLDAGVFSSHIGFESAISMDNTTLTRSICAENSPYFLSGVKLSYSPNKKVEMAGVVTNGWQKIQRIQGNSIPSFGTQFVYKPSERITLNWSTFIGTNTPDDLRKMRYFSNIYGKFNISKRFNLIAGFDYGLEQRSKHHPAYNNWFSPALISQIILSENWCTAIRLEYFEDKNGVIIPSPSIEGFQVTGVSLNFDYSPVKAILCRIEGRWLNASDAIFVTKSNFDFNNYSIAASIAVRFSETLNKK